MYCGLRAGKPVYLWARPATATQRHQWKFVGFDGTYIEPPYIWFYHRIFGIDGSWSSRAEVVDHACKLLIQRVVGLGL